MVLQVKASTGKIEQPTLVKSIATLVLLSQLYQPLEITFLVVKNEVILLFDILYIVSRLHTVIQWLLVLY